MAAKMIVYISLEVEVEIEDEILNSETYEDEIAPIRDRLYQAFDEYDIGSVRVEPGVIIVQNGSGEPEIYDL